MTHRVTKPILWGLLGCVILAYLGLLTGLNLSRYEQVTVAQSQRYLSILARAQANHLEGLFGTIQTELEIAAVHPTIRQLVAGSGESSPEDGGLKPLEDLRRRMNTLIGTLFVLDATGHTINQIPKPSDPGIPDYSLWPDIRLALQRQKTTLSEVLTLSNGTQAVSLCVPVKDSGQVLGWIRAMIPLDSINALIEPIRMGIGGYAWILDRRGDLISYPDELLWGRSVFALRLRELGDLREEDRIIDRMIKGIAGVDRFVSGTESQRKTTMAWSPMRIADTHWTVGVCMDETEQISAPLQEQARDMILMTVCILAAMTLATVMYFRYERKKAHLAAHLAIGRVNDELQMLSFEHTQTEEDLQSKLNALREILDAIPYGLYWKDRAGVFRGSNTAFARMVGLDSPDEIRGKTETDLSRRGTWSGPPMQYDREVIRTGIGLVNVERRQTIQGKMVTLLSSKVPLRDGRGTIWGILGIAADITDAQQKRDQQEEIHELIFRILDRIPTGIAAADASGTIREISGSATNLLGRPRSDWIGRNLTELVPPAHRDEVQAGIDDLRRSVRSTPVSIRFSTGQQDIHAHLSSLIRQGRIDGFWISLTDITEYIDNRDRAEYAKYRTGQFLERLSHQIRTAMQNILGFSEILRQEQTDTAGNPHLRQITENATQLLQVADELVHMCRNETASESPESAKAEIPQTDAPQPPPSPAPSQSSVSPETAANEGPSPQEDRSEPTILVVDDVPENRSLLDIILNRAGYRVEMANHGQDAIEKSRQRRYDLILMDMQMPVMNGFDATRIIRAEGLNRTTIIVAMTASVEKGDELKCLEAGCDDFIGKPVKKDLLLRKIWRFLQQVKQLETAEKGGLIVSFLAGDPDYQKTIETFVNNLPGRLEEMRKSFEEGNLADLALKAHALKGLGGFAGFAVFTEKARILEGTIQERDLTRIRFELDEMSDLCRRTRIGADGMTA